MAREHRGRGRAAHAGAHLQLALGAEGGRDGLPQRPQAHVEIDLSVDISSEIGPKVTAGVHRPAVDAKGRDVEHPRAQPDVLDEQGVDALEVAEAPQLHRVHREAKPPGVVRLGPQIQPLDPRGARRVLHLDDRPVDLQAGPREPLGGRARGLGERRQAAELHEALGVEVQPGRGAVDHHRAQGRAALPPVEPELEPLHREEGGGDRAVGALRPDREAGEGDRGRERVHAEAGQHHVQAKPALQLPLQHRGEAALHPLGAQRPKPAPDQERAQQQGDPPATSAGRSGLGGSAHQCASHKRTESPATVPERGQGRAR